MSIWTDNYLNQLGGDAEQQINQEIQCIYFRFYLPIQNGLPVYTLPNQLRTISRITYRGKQLDPLNWEEMQSMAPAVVWVNSGLQVNSVNSRPLFYSMHPTNPYDIRLFPTPNENLDFPTITAGDPYGPTVNEKHCTVACFRDIDSTLSDSNLLLPTYIDRRTRKAFILWKAFEAEGKGQNLKASQYYKNKFTMLIKKFLLINDSCFLSKKYSLEDEGLTTTNFKYPKPQLPTNFERILY